MIGARTSALSHEVHAAEDENSVRDATKIWLRADTSAVLTATDHSSRGQCAKVTSYCRASRCGNASVSSVSERPRYLRVGMRSAMCHSRTPEQRNHDAMGTGKL